MKEFFLNDPFYLTILLIVSAVIVGVLSKARNKDRCLKHFKKHNILLETIKQQIVAEGVLKVKSTGLEIKLSKPQEPADGIRLATYLLYKYEFEQIQTIIADISAYSEKNIKLRNKKYKQLTHPGIYRRIIRKIRNIFNSLKDSFIEVMNIGLSYLTAKKYTALRAHDKYVRNLNTEILESMGMSHDPLLENYLGKCVVIEFLKGTQKVYLKGILYDYTKKFIEILNVDYFLSQAEKMIKADLILPQKHTIIRGLCDTEILSNS
jgi:hypothetical protein